MKKVLSILILAILVPSVVIGGACIFHGAKWTWISACVVILACIPVFLHFEHSKTDAKRLCIIAVMTALSVVGRMAFSAIPGFKPVTAIVVLTAMYFGGESGFLVGSLSALLSNIYFGQGAWTPFQMFAWGTVGLLAGLLAKPLKKHLWVLAIYAVLSGILYSFLMDIWTVLWMDGYFNISRYLVAIASSAKFTAVYAVSNLLFLLLLAYPAGKVFTRIKKKYGV